MLLVDAAAKPPPAPAPVSSRKSGSRDPARKRSRGGDESEADADADVAKGGAAWTLSTRYSPLLAARWRGADVVVAENPWLAIAEQQTARPILRKTYGRG